MPLPVRPIAVTIAVICFFVLGFVAWISGLSPFTCCKRTLAGAALAYLVAALAVKAINAILINAMITKQIKQEKEKGGGGGH